MSYMDKLDRKKTIKKAKKELNNFSNLYVLNQNYFVHINGSTFTNSVINIVNHINYDLKTINSITKKDRQIEEIERVIEAVSQLPDKQEVQYIYYKYFVRYDSSEIAGMLETSIRTMSRIADNAHFNLALLLHIEVEKEEE